MYNYTYTYTYKHIYVYMHILIYTSNLFYRDRMAFLQFFSKSYFNDIFCSNVNQFILTYWTHVGEIFSEY